MTDKIVRVMEFEMPLMWAVIGGYCVVNKKYIGEFKQRYPEAQITN